MRSDVSSTSCLISGDEAEMLLQYRAKMLGGHVKLVRIYENEYVLFFVRQGVGTMLVVHEEPFHAVPTPVEHALGCYCFHAKENHVGSMWATILGQMLYASGKGIRIFLEYTDKTFLERWTSLESLRIEKDLGWNGSDTSTSEERRRNKDGKLNDNG